MPSITGQELLGHIAAGTFAPLYLLYGDEKLTLKRAAHKLIGKSSGEGFPEFNRALFTNDSDIEGIAAAVEALPFMAGHKCAAVSDFDPETRSPEDMERLLSLLEDLPESCTLIFWYPTLNIPEKRSSRWKKLLEAADRAGYTVDFARLGAADLKRLIMKEARRQGCELSQKSWEKLFGYAGNDLHTLRSEADKLCAYALGLGESEITPAMVEELTPKSTETTVFIMVRALTAGRYEEAFRQLDLLFYRGDEPVAILGAMASAYIDMYRVKAALESGLTGSAPAGYAPEYKGRGSFRLQNAERSAKKLTLRDIGRCLELLLEADLSLKGSRLDPRLVLEGLISRLLLAVQP